MARFKQSELSGGLAAKIALADAREARRRASFKKAPVVKARAEKPSKQKYGARKVVVAGVSFDSEKEARRWQELCLRQRAGDISDLTRQVVYELAPGTKLPGEPRARPAVRYIADFRYWDKESRAWVVEDSKGFDTPMGRLKRHLMKTVHHIDVIIT